MCYAYVPAWLEVAELLAAGDKWPSIHECKEALRHAKAKPSVPVIESHEVGWMTKEEFGTALYETVKTVSLLREAPESCKDGLRAQLAQQFKGLTVDEQAAVLGRYRDLVNL